MLATHDQAAGHEAKYLLAARQLSKEEYLGLMPPVFRDLYGPMAEPAALLLWNTSGPVFAVDAMVRAYGSIWRLPGPLSLAEKSLATVAALVAQGLHPQIKLHINGFLSSGGRLPELFALVRVASQDLGPEAVEPLVDSVFAGLKWREQSVAGFQAPSLNAIEDRVRAGDFALSDRWRALTGLAAEIGLGRHKKVREAMRNTIDALDGQIDSEKFMDSLITHLILYCGYPKGMNAFQAWASLTPAA